MTLTGFYCFVENYMGAGLYPYNWNGGAMSRTGTYGRAFKLTTGSKWIDSYIATFTVDDCGGKKYRFDSSAGLTTDGRNFFFLQMGGFGDAYTVPRTVFKRKPEAVPEDLNSPEKLQFLYDLWRKQ